MSDLRVSVGETGSDGLTQVLYQFGDAEYPDRVDLTTGWKRERSIKRACEALGLPAENLPVLGAELVRLAKEKDQADEGTSEPKCRPRPKILTLRQLYDEDLPIPDELIQGVLHKGTKLAFGGASKGYKSWVLESMAIAVASGIPWFGLQTRRSSVLFTDLELPRPFLRRRLETLHAAMDAPADVEDWLDVLPLRGFNASHREIIPLMIDRMAGKDYGLAVLDPIYKLYGQGMDENSAGCVAELMDSIERLTAETGAAVAFGAHYSKGNQASKNSIDRVSGSGVFARDPDSLLNVTAHAEDDLCYTLDVTLRNFPPMKPFVVEWRFPLFQRRNDLDPAALKKPGRQPKYTATGLLAVLVDGMSSGDWEAAGGMCNETYLKLRRELEFTKEVQQINQRWEKSR